MGRLRTRAEDDKAFHFRMPRETWLLLKKASLIKDMTMADVCVEFIEKQRNNLGKKMGVIGAVAEAE